MKSNKIYEIQCLLMEIHALTERKVVTSNTSLQTSLYMLLGDHLAILPTFAVAVTNNSQSCCHNITVSG